MNAKAQSRINEIDKQTNALVKRADHLDLSPTERAQIAIDIRRLLSERENITSKKSPTYKTVDSSTLFRIVQRWIR
jgi:transcriptional regulator of NAD metabolism